MADELPPHHRALRRVGLSDATRVPIAWVFLAVGITAGALWSVAHELAVLNTRITVLEVRLEMGHPK